MEWLYNKILLNDKNKWNSKTYYNMDAAWKHGNSVFKNLVILKELPNCGKEFHLVGAKILKLDCGDDFTTLWTY